ncbi:MAG: HEAT repeat domain-containing protein [Planctomycetes bacterium]|nr:HEAT repeat domain-containing protein [Planctomycetota bacterium]
MNARPRPLSIRILAIAGCCLLAAGWLLTRMASAPVLPAGTLMTANTQRGECPASPTATGGDERVAATEERRGFYSAPVGQVLRHAFTATTTLALRSQQAAGSTDVMMQVHGGMQVTVLARRTGELIVQVSFDQVEGTTRQGSNEFPLRSGDPLAQALAAPTEVWLRDDGQTLGYRFAAATSPEYRNWIRGLWSAHRFVAAAEQQWTTREEDIVGTAAGSYRWTEPFVTDGAITGGHLRKDTSGYLVNDAHATATVTGRGEAHLNPSIGWLERARWQETVKVALDEVAMTTTSTLAAEWRLREVDWATALESVSWDAAWEPVCGNQERGGQSDAEADRYRQRLSGVSVDQLCAELAAMVAAGSVSSPEGYGKKLDLTWLLKLQPDALARAMQVLPTLSNDVAGLLLSAIGGTELPSAQAFLASVFGDAARPVELRQSAAWAMVQVREPALDVVQRFAASLAADQPFDAGVAAGVLALGTMAGRVADDARPAAFAQLLGMEAHAVRHGALANWLEAVGNAGRPEGLAAALRHQHSDDPMVRTAAVSAVRSLTGDVALALLLAGAADGEPMVRARAVEILAERTEPAALPRVAQVLADDADPRVRLTAVQVLAGQAHVPQVAQLLQRVAGGDADPEVRAAATAALQGR